MVRRRFLFMYVSIKTNSKGYAVARTITRNIEKDNYRSEALIVWCFDARFWEMLYEFIKLEEYRHPDIVLVDGGAKDLASNDFRKRDFLVSQVQASVSRHQTRSLILMMHAGCEAYNKEFYQDTEEIEFYTEELKKAREALIFAVGDSFQIRTFYADFYGLTEFYT